MNEVQKCEDCRVKILLERDGFVGICDAMLVCLIMESIAGIRHGSVEIIIQDSKVVQIDKVMKRRLR